LPRTDLSDHRARERTISALQRSHDIVERKPQHRHPRTSYDIVIPAKAGIHFATVKKPMDSRLRGNDVKASGDDLTPRATT